MRTLRHRAMIVMLLALVYQWGACPCGCVEHNAWLEWVGLDHHHDHDHATPMAADPTVSAADDHDCSGAARPYFLTKTDRFSDLAQASEVMPAAFDSPLGLALTNRSDVSLRGPPLIGPPRAHLAALQVFLL